MPVGVPGELCVGGVAVAQGYLNRPELTAEKFVANPHADGMLYRTGDLARWLPDGNIEFLGRTDRQIKIRGFRIEPGEIEAVIERHPEIRAGCRDDRAGTRGEARLVAYVTTVGSAAARGGRAPAVRRRARSRLHGSGGVGHVDSFPLTPNGKVDVSALPEPEWDRSAATEEFVAPRTATERAVASVWSDVLGIEEVGVNDNFFDLGGHSLLAVRMVAELDRAHRREVCRWPASSRTQRSATLAVAIDKEHEDEAPWESLLPLRPEGTKAPLYLFSWVGGEVFGYREFVQRYPEGRPLYGLRAPGLDRRSMPFATIEEIADALSRRDPAVPARWAVPLRRILLRWSRGLRGRAATDGGGSRIGVRRAHELFPVRACRRHASHRRAVTLPAGSSRRLQKRRAFGAKLGVVKARLTSPSSPQRRLLPEAHFRSGVRAYRLAARTGWRWPQRYWRFGLIAGELAKAAYVTPSRMFASPSSALSPTSATSGRRSGADWRAVESTCTPSRQTASPISR